MDSRTPIIPQNLFSAKDAVAVITGGATGIGFAMASVLSETGARRVYILGRRQDRLSQAAQILNQHSQVVVPVVCDVASQESVIAAVTIIKQDSEYVDILINNAGRAEPFRDISSSQTIEEMRDQLLKVPEEVNDVLRTNTASIISVTAAFLPLLYEGNLRKGWPDNKLSPDDVPSKLNTDLVNVCTSQIITISSTTAFERNGFAGLGYSASKAGAVHIGKMLATILVPWNIRSNVVVPGAYPSEMTTDFLSANDITVSFTPSGRAGSLSDVAGFLLYLVGSAGGFVNGSVLVSDGGRLAIQTSSY